MELIIDTTEPVDLTPPTLPKTGIPVIDEVTERVLGGGHGEEQAVETLESVSGPIANLTETLFIRGVVVILGFIFVAVGLSMFRGE